MHSKGAPISQYGHHVAWNQLPPARAAMAAQKPCIDAILYDDEKNASETMYAFAQNRISRYSAARKASPREVLSNSDGSMVMPSRPRSLLAMTEVRSGAATACQRWE